MPCTDYRLFYNGVEAVDFTDLAIRVGTSISSVGGLYFSTFFGGNDDSWASPTQQYTYYRNIQLYAGYGASNSSGDKITSGASAVVPGNWGIFSLAIVSITAALLGSI